MGITVYSVVISVVFFNLALVAAFILRRSGAYLARYTVAFLLLTVLLGILRLLTPIDFDNALVVRSYRVIPAIEAFLTRPVAGDCTIGSLLLWLWLAGALAFLIRDMLIQLRFVRASSNYPPSERRDLLDLAGELGINFNILVSSSISRPYTAGLLRPTVYLPDIELSEEQWRTILRHEVQHIRSHDEWKKLFFAAIQALFWWNPLAHISRREIDTLIELQCDARVTAAMSAEEVTAYLETLMYLTERSRRARIPVGASPLVWDQEQLAVRFEALDSADTSAKKRPRIAAYIVLFTVFVLSYFVIVQPAGFASEDLLAEDLSVSDDYQMNAVVESSSEMYLVLKDGQYYLYANGIPTSAVSEENLTIPPFDSLPILEDNS